MRAPGPTKNLYLVTDISNDKSVLRNPPQNVYLDNLFSDDGGNGSALGSQIQYGRFVTDISGAGSVTFTTPFTATPTILVSPDSVFSFVIAKSSSGFTVQTYDVDGSTPVGEISVSWAAFGTPAS